MSSGKAIFRGVLTLLGPAMLFLAVTPVSAQDDEVVTKARPLEIQKWAAQVQSDYPVEALTAGEEGTVAMALTIGTTGRVKECTVYQSSGSTALDEGACYGMKKHARYTPATGADGDPVESELKQSVRYILPDGGPTMPRTVPINPAGWKQAILDEYPAEAIKDRVEGKVSAMLYVSADGFVRGCVFNGPRNTPILEAALCSGALRHARFEPVESDDGMPRLYGLSIIYELPR